MNIHDTELTDVLCGKFETLKTQLKEYDALALAFSGGVDSSFLLAAAKSAGIRRILAVTVVSSFFTRKELDRAKKTAERLGVEHRCVDMAVLDLPDVVRNDALRCYHCKLHSFSKIKETAARHDIHVIAHGINTDDLGDYRPGIEAAKALGFKAPLVTSGFSKKEIRLYARVLGLDSWDLPSQSCLATRIPVGDKITQKVLDMIEKAEDVLHDMGLEQVRVRCHHDLARIEVLPCDILKVCREDERIKINRAFKDIGFSFVALDLGGYKTGKMNKGAGDQT